eukprot:3934415-Rhodomonas_salina.1
MVAKPRPSNQDVRPVCARTVDYASSLCQDCGFRRLDFAVYVPRRSQPSYRARPNECEGSQRTKVNSSQRTKVNSRHAVRPKSKCINRSFLVPILRRLCCVALASAVGLAVFAAPESTASKRSLVHSAPEMC